MRSSQKRLEPEVFRNAFRSVAEIRLSETERLCLWDDDANGFKPELIHVTSCRPGRIGGQSRIGNAVKHGIQFGCTFRNLLTSHRLGWNLCLRVDELRCFTG